MLHLNARAGYPNSKKGRKMKYKDSLIQIQNKREKRAILKLLLFPVLLMFKQN